MSSKATSTKRAAAATTKSGQAVTIFSEDGFSVAGSVITPTTAVALSIVEPGATKEQSTIVKPSAPVISSYTISGADDLALDPAGGQTIFINGKGFKTGVTVFLDTGFISVVTFISESQISFTAPAKSAGTYTVYVTNTDGGTAVMTPGLVYSSFPAFTTNAGSLGSYYETQTIDEVISATADSSVSYSLYSGALPTGATINSAGYITGTAPVDGSSNTYTFTIKATDQELQDSTRSFSLTINTDVVSWTSPDNGTTYTSVVDTPISNVTLIAVSSANANDAITYTANALPTGVTLSDDTISGTANTIEQVTTLLTATASTTGRSATRVIYWTIKLGNDPYFKNITTLLSSAVNANSASFIQDSSSSNRTVLTSDNPLPSNINPFQEGYYSNYFAGAGYIEGGTDYAGFEFDGDFTVEAWINPTITSSLYGIITYFNNTAPWYGWTLNINAGKLMTYCYNNSTTTSLTGTTTIPVNKWTHVAFTRSGSTYSLFVNGTLDATSTSLDIGTGGSNKKLRVGNWNYSTPRYFSGNISNVRIVKGTALYTSTFTPPTTALTAVSGTTFLTCQSAYFKENSSAALSLTNSGVQITGFQPFMLPSEYSTYGSGYFDGVNDYAYYTEDTAISTSDDFCWEMWLYPTTARSGQNRPFGSTTAGANDPMLMFNGDGTKYTSAYLYFRNSSVWNYTISIEMKQWIHLAVTRSAGVLKVFINGVARGSTPANSTSFASAVWRIGSQATSNTLNFAGYISNYRIVVGSPVYTSDFTPPTTPLTAISGTTILTLQNNGSHNSSTFKDTSGSNDVVTRNGNPVTGSFSPFGNNWSVYLDGTGDYMTVGTGTSSYVSAPGTGDFTVEAWIMHNGTGSSYQDIFVNNGKGLLLNSGNLQGYGLSVISSGTDFRALSGWQHVAMSRQSGTIRLFHNGTQIASASSTDNWAAGATTVQIGAWSTGTSEFFPGHISNLRYVVGTALYTANFTPPTEPLTAVSGTVILTCQSNRFVDNSTNNYVVQRYGDIKTEPFSPFSSTDSYDTSIYSDSMYFDGTGDYLQIPKTETVDGGLGSGDFTIEYWVNQTNYGTGQRNHFALLSDAYVAATSIFLWTTSGGVLQVYQNGSAKNSGIVLPLLSWNHIALVKSSGTTKLYLNGTSILSFADTATYTTNPVIWLGSDSFGDIFYGYLSNFRIVRGTALYTSDFTPPTTPLSATPDTSLLLAGSQSGIADASRNINFESLADVKKVNISPYSSGVSYYFDGTGDYLDAKNSTYLNSFYKDFTIEFWLNYTSVSGSGDFLGTSNNTAYDGTSLGGWVVAISGGKIRFGAQYSSAWLFDATFNTTISTGTWTHVALVRSGSTIKCYINGVAEATTATSSANVISTYDLRIGAERRGTVSALLNGYITDLRITNGVARYTSNFSVPTEPFILK